MVLSTLSVLSIRVMITSNALIRSLSQARSIGWEVIVDDRPKLDAAPSLIVPSIRRCDMFISFFRPVKPGNGTEGDP